MHGVEKNRKRRKKIQQMLYEISFILEFIVAIFVICTVSLSIISLFQNLGMTYEMLGRTAVYENCLKMALDVAIGIEFLKMLCRHNMGAVVEVLMFALARELVVEDTTMLDNLFCVMSVGILFVVRKYLYVPQKDSYELVKKGWIRSIVKTTKREESSKSDKAEEKNSEECA